jgi:hypothetical protein
MLVIPATQEVKTEDGEFQDSSNKISETLSGKQNKNKRAGGTVMGHLPSMCEALGSITCTSKIIYLIPLVNFKYTVCYY